MMKAFSFFDIYSGVKKNEFKSLSLIPANGA